MIVHIQGKSMYPTLIEGETYHTVKPKNLKVGDIVIARIKHKNVVKRITSINANGTFDLFGDNRQASRNFINVSKLRIIRKLGKPTFFTWLARSNSQNGIDEYISEKKERESKALKCKACTYEKTCTGNPKNKKFSAELEVIEDVEDEE